jgi:hypothetical protein
LTALADQYGNDVAKWIGNPVTPVKFRAFEVFEEIPRYSTKVIETPAEEYIRPGWYGPIWKPSEVGKVYDQFFKTGAITDPTDIGDSQGASIGRSDAEEEAADADLINANPFTTDLASSQAILRLDPKVSIAQAVEFLVMTYSYIRQAPNVNIDDFVMAYTSRPIASMVDMFGTYNLTLSPDGSSVLSGYEGFHSRAFGPYDDLFGLVTSDIENVLGIKRGATAAQKADTRKRKQMAVLDYLSALQLSRAVLG